MSFVTRAKHTIMGPIMRVVPIPVPELVTGQGSSRKVGSICKDRNLSKVLVVTDNILPTLGLLDLMFQGLEETGVQYVLYDKVTPDPDTKTCADGAKLYVKEKCDAIVAFGGGSSMDAAKYIGMLSNDPDADPLKYIGLSQLSPFKSVPCLIAIPTTAGTGSEATIAAVISDKEAKQKFSAVDMRLTADVAVFDPLLLEKLPKSITAATGIDALTHAIESYLNTFRGNFSMELSLRAIKDVFEYLPRCYKDGSDLEAREKMLLASFNAGQAFTRASVGYVHAVAHQLGALFHIPHGEANSIVLPHVLDFFRSTGKTPILTNLAKMCLVVENRGNETVLPSEREALADRFIQHVRRLCKEVNVPTYAKGFAPDMVEEVVTRALNECHAAQFSFSEQPLKAIMDVGYPVPAYMTNEQMTNIVMKVVDPNASRSKL